jgi:hypothetical protein
MTTLSHFDILGTDVASLPPGNLKLQQPHKKSFFKERSNGICTAKLQKLHCQNFQTLPYSTSPQGFNTDFINCPSCAKSYRKGVCSAKMPKRQKPYTLHQDLPSPRILRPGTTLTMLTNFLKLCNPLCHQQRVLLNRTCPICSVHMESEPQLHKCALSQTR